VAADLVAVPARLAIFVARTFHALQIETAQPGRAGDALVALDAQTHSRLASARHGVAVVQALLIIEASDTRVRGRVADMPLSNTVGGRGATGEAQREPQVADRGGRMTIVVVDARHAPWRVVGARVVGRACRPALVQRAAAAKARATRVAAARKRTCNAAHGGNQADAAPAALATALAACQAAVAGAAQTAAAQTAASQTAAGG